MKYILNSFSINMIDPSIVQKMRIEPVTPAEIHESYTAGEAINSAVGHENTAALFETILNDGAIASYIPVKFNRQTICLGEGDIAFVGQYVGERLPEGVTTLPAGARIDWFKVHCPKPKNRVVVASVRSTDLRSFDFQAAYAAAVEKLAEDELIGHVGFTFAETPNDLVCTIVTK